MAEGAGSECGKDGLRRKQKTWRDDSRDSLWSPRSCTTCLAALNRRTMDWMGLMERSATEDTPCVFRCAM